MKTVPFKASVPLSLGTELEFQIIHPESFGLISRAKDLMRYIKESPLQKCIKPEITQSMIEVNSSIHSSPKELLNELETLQNFLLEQGKKLNIAFCGGGTHPFQKWSTQKIFPSMRFKNLSSQYRYLSKRCTVFGQHIHIGCGSGEDALYLTHALGRYVPHFIAICASSPYYQGVDTGYYSCRSTIFTAFPQSGVIPYLTSWDEFSAYFYKLRNLGIISSMKDFYWDVRPKPEFGTVEIRVCDTPLTLEKATLVAAYVQSLANYLLHERPFSVNHDLYYLYTYNRFQASRYGFDGEFINPYSLQKSSIADDLLETLKKIERYANQLNNMGYISQLLDLTMNKDSDSLQLRKIMKQVDSLPEVVHQQCKIWSGDEDK